MSRSIPICIICIVHEINTDDAATKSQHVQKLSHHEKLLASDVAIGLRAG